MKSRLLNETRFLYIAHMDCIYFREPTKMQSRKKKLFEFQMLRVLALLRTMRDKVIVFSPPELTYDVSKFT